MIIEKKATIVLSEFEKDELDTAILEVFKNEFENEQRRV